MSLTGRRRTAWVLFATSLLFAALYIVTKIYFASFSHASSGKTQLIGAADGDLLVGWSINALPNNKTWWGSLQRELPSGFHFQGLGGISTPWSSFIIGQGAVTTETIHTFPLILPAVLAVLLAAWFAFRGRARVGHCSHCGYNLAASPERCPECGKPSKITAS